MIDFFMVISSLLHFLQTEESSRFLHAGHATHFRGAVGMSPAHGYSAEATFQIYLRGTVWQLFAREAF
jgi:hypothetical protein